MFTTYNWWFGTTSELIGEALENSWAHDIRECTGNDDRLISAQSNQLIHRWKKKTQANKKRQTFSPSFANKTFCSSLFNENSFFYHLFLFCPFFLLLIRFFFRSLFVSQVLFRCIKSSGELLQRDPSWLFISLPVHKQSKINKSSFKCLKKKSVYDRLKIFCKYLLIK